MNQSSLVLLLCLSPLAAVFIVMKLALWLAETSAFRAETEKLKRMQHGPYEVWDDEEEDDEMDLDYLYQEIIKMKNETLMEEPCPLYEPEWEDVTNSAKDWEDFWHNEARTSTDNNERRSSGDD
jgi:hypothetical protein